MSATFCMLGAFLALIARIVSGEQWWSIVFHIYVAASMVCVAVEHRK